MANLSTAKLRRQHRGLALAGVLLCCTPQALAQLERVPPPNGQPSQSLAGATQRADKNSLDLKCRLNTRGPEIDYEFRFVSPYWVECPVKLLRGTAPVFDTTVTVRPLSVEGAEPIRVNDVYRIREVPEDAKGTMEFSGSFALGEGSYEVNWELSDREGRSCRFTWKLEAGLARRHRDVDLTLKPGEIRPGAVYLFRPEPAVAGGDPQLRVKILMNLDVPMRRRSRVQVWRYVPMISGLRVMSRHPALAQFAVVAFSVEEQKVLQRQEFSDRIDFPALGWAVKSLSPATVEVQTLREGSDLAFLDHLLAEELADPERVDAFLFVGSDDRFGKKVSAATLEQIRRSRVPVFHFNSTPYLWRGAIGNAVKSLGGKEYRVRQPYDLAAAVDKLVAEIFARRPPAR